MYKQCDLDEKRYRNPLFFILGLPNPIEGYPRDVEELLAPYNRQMLIIDPLDDLAGVVPLLEDLDSEEALMKRLLQEDFAIRFANRLHGQVMRDFVVAVVCEIVEDYLANSFVEADLNEEDRRAWAESAINKAINRRLHALQQKRKERTAVS